MKNPTERKSWFYDTKNKRKWFLLRCLADFFFFKKNTFYMPFVRLRVRTLIWFSFYSDRMKRLDALSFRCILSLLSGLVFFALHSHPLPLFILFRSVLSLQICTHHTLHLFGCLPSSHLLLRGSYPLLLFLTLLT